MPVETEDNPSASKELLRVKAALAESEARYHLLVEHSCDNIIIHDLTGTILFINESRLSVLGATAPGEIVGRDAMDFVHPADREMVKAVIGEALEEYRQGRDSRRVIEHRMLRLDGTEFYGEATGAFVIYNGGLALQLIVRDITGRKVVEKALRESEQRTVMAQKAGHIGIWDWNPLSGGLVWSDEIYTMLGFEPGEVEPNYELFLEKLHREDRPVLDRAVKDSLLNKVAYKVDCRVIREDGTELTAEAMGNVEYDGNGTATRMFGTFKDITERKRVEAELKESLHRHRSLFENMLSGAAYHKILLDGSGRPENYIFLEVNKAFEKYTGFDRRDVIGKLATDVIPSIDELEPDLIQLYGAVALTGKGRTFDLFMPRIGKWFSVSAYCPEKGFFVATFFDVTGRKWSELDLRQEKVDLEKRVEADTQRLTEAQKMLGHEVVERKKAGVRQKEADDRFRTIFDTSNDATLLLGEEGFIDFNDATLKIFGCTERGELLGGQPYEWSPVTQPDGRTSVEAAAAEVAAAFKEGHNFFAWTHRRADGEDFPAEVLLTPMRIDGQEVVHATIRDITKRMNLEKEKEILQSQLLQAQKMEAVGTLAGGIAHDFNNILTVVKSLSSLLLTKIESGSGLRQYVEPLLYASERGTNLVQQLLIFSQSKPCEVATFDLNDAIEELLVMLRSLIDDDIGIEERLDARVSGVDGDRGRIEQVITNIIINSSDALPQGGDILITTVNVTVTGRPDSPKGRAHRPGEYLCVKIEDNGVGMDADTVEHIFEPFFTTKSPNGTGLGLSFVYGILKEMNGWIDVKSTPGAGTVFSIYFPCATATGTDGGEVGEEVSVAGSVVGPASGDGARVLLVEDDKWVRKSTAMALFENGYTVLEARDAADAVNLFTIEKGRFDIVLSDVVMPGMDGLQMMDALHNISPDMPVLFYSGHIDDKAQLNAIIRKGFSFLQKPFEVVDLLRAVEDGIGREKE